MACFVKRALPGRQRGRSTCYGVRARIVRRAIEDAEVGKFGAGGDEGVVGVAFAEAVVCDALFADAGREAREVAVAGHDAWIELVVGGLM